MEVNAQLSSLTIRTRVVLVLRMDLIEPDMDMHNGVIFLGLPTEVVHKASCLKESSATQHIRWTMRVRSLRWCRKGRKAIQASSRCETTSGSTSPGLFLVVGTPQVHLFGDLGLGEHLEKGA